MSRRRFFVDRFIDGTATLSGDAAHHLGRVLRAEPGQVYELSDGREIYLARLESLGGNAAHFALLEPIASDAATLQIALLIAVVKFDRFEWALEKATELGANVIVPIAAERSGNALVAAAPKRAARWRKILQESAQQARCLRPPVLEELAEPAEAFRAASASSRILLSERPGAPPLRDVLEEAAAAMPVAPKPPAADGLQLKPSQLSARKLSLAIGPEGGWTDAEFAAAEAAGFREAALGRNILRTETAVVAGLAAAQLYLSGKLR